MNKPNSDTSSAYRAARANSLTGIAVVSFVIAFILVLTFIGKQDVPAFIFFAVYSFLLALLVAIFRDEQGFKMLMPAGKGKWLLTFYLLVMAFTLLPVFANRFSFNRMAWVNGSIIICSIVFAFIITGAIVYKNRNLNTPGYNDKLYLTGIGLLTLLLAYGFSIELNCLDFFESPKTYPVAVAYKYIEAGSNKNGVYHTPHFVVENWPASQTFGNDIVIPEKWFNRYPNINTITTGDTIVLKVHTGLLKLGWIEVENFTKIAG